MILTVISTWSLHVHMQNTMHYVQGCKKKKKKSLPSSEPIVHHNLSAIVISNISDCRYNKYNNEKV